MTNIASMLSTIGLGPTPPKAMAIAAGAALTTAGTGLAYTALTDSPEEARSMAKPLLMAAGGGAIATFFSWAGFASHNVQRGLLGATAGLAMAGVGALLIAEGKD